jgi:uncharacterized protein
MDDSLARCTLFAVAIAACGGDDLHAPDPNALPNAGVIDGTCAGQPAAPRVLVYTYENMWRHVSNYYARNAVLAMCDTRGYTVSSSNDPRVFNAAQLAQFDVVVFAVTSGSGMSADGRAAFEAWARAGGGIVGLHSASFTELDFPFYVAAIGPQFNGHVGGTHHAMVTIERPHPITSGLSAFPLEDEWYVFTERPETVRGVHVLLAIDEDTLPADYPADAKIGYHAIGWTHDNGLSGGRVFYTAIGHAIDAYSEPTFLELLGRSIAWAARRI